MIIILQAIALHRLLESTIQPCYNSTLLHSILLMQFQLVSSSQHKLADKHDRQQRLNRKVGAFCKPLPAYYLLPINQRH